MTQAAGTRDIVLFATGHKSPAPQLVKENIADEKCDHGREESGNDDRVAEGNMHRIAPLEKVKFQFECTPEKSGCGQPVRKMRHSRTEAG